MSIPCYTCSWAMRVSSAGDVGTAEAAVGTSVQGSLSQLLPLGFSQDHRDEVAERLLTLKDGLVHPDPTILFHTCHSIAQVPKGSHNKKGGCSVGLRDFSGSTCYL